ncbi:MAG: winged helix-turn-helix domain-containing protein [Rubrivivax sp.]
MDSPLHDDSESFDAGHLRLSRRQRQLWLGGVPVKLGGRAFDLLCVLIDQGEQLLHKHELLDRVWPRLVVEENNLHTQVKALRQALGAGVLATVPGRGYRFTLVRDAAASAPSPPAEPAAGPPPPPASSTGPELLGRDDDLSELRARLLSGACVTLTGPAGVGKTALAQALAAATGAPLVDLLPLQDAALLAARVGDALGLSTAGTSPLRALAQGLAGRSGGLVLDNAEHLVADVAALVQAVRAGAPGLWVLVTSQVPLHLGDEQVMRLAPLPLPRTDDALADASRSPAVQLFAAAVRRLDRHFELSASNVGTVVRLCQGLDGLPLALRLAAARVPMLGLQAVLRQLQEQPTRLLAGGPRDAAPRHASLQAALDWSTALLSAPERNVLARLGVLPGPFTLELAAALAAEGTLDEWAVIEALAVLVDHSLLEVEDGEPMRYRLLDSVRAHALAQLRASGELAAVCGRAADLLQQRFTAEGEREPVTLARLCAEAGRPADALHHWLRAADRAAAESRLVEVEHHLSQAVGLLRQPPLGDAPDGRRQRIELLLRLGAVVGLTQGLAADRTDAVYREALELADETQFAEARFVALFNRTFTTTMRLQADTAESLLPELARLADRLDDPRLHLQYEHALYSTISLYGRLEESLAAAESSYRRYRASDSAWHCRQFAGHDPGVCSAGHAALGALLLGRPALARTWLRALEQQLDACTHGPSRVIGFNIVAGIGVLARDTTRVRQVASEWHRQCQRMGIPVYANLAAMHEGWAEAMDESAPDAAAVDRIGAAFGRVLALGIRFRMPLYHVLWVEALARHGRTAEAQAQAEACLRTMEQQRERVCRPWLLAVCAELCEQAGNDELAEDHWRRALRDARGMHAGLYALRAALGLARLRRRSGGRACPELAEELVHHDPGERSPDLDAARAWMVSGAA